MGKPFDASTSFMAVCAFRYCMGRQSYAVGICIEWLKANWGRILPNDRAVIVRDLEEEFSKPQEYRRLGNPLIDEPRWEMFLEWARAYSIVERP